MSETQWHKSEPVEPLSQLDEVAFLKYDNDYGKEQKFLLWKNEKPGMVMLDFDIYKEGRHLSDVPPQNTVENILETISSLAKYTGKPWTVYSTGGGIWAFCNTVIIGGERFEGYSTEGFLRMVKKFFLSQMSPAEQQEVLKNDMKVHGQSMFTQAQPDPSYLASVEANECFAMRISFKEGDTCVMSEICKFNENGEKGPTSNPIWFERLAGPLTSPDPKAIEEMVSEPYEWHENEDAFRGAYWNTKVCHMQGSFRYWLVDDLGDQVDWTDVQYVFHAIKQTLERLQGYGAWTLQRLHVGDLSIGAMSTILEKGFGSIIRLRLPLYRAMLQTSDDSPEEVVEKMFTEEEKCEMMMLMANRIFRIFESRAS